MGSVVSCHSGNASDISDESYPEAETKNCRMYKKTTGIFDLHEKPNVNYIKPDCQGKSFLENVKVLGEEGLSVLGKAFDFGINAVEDTILFLTKKINGGFYSETTIKGVYTYNGIHDDLEGFFNLDVINELSLLKDVSGTTKAVEDLIGKEKTKKNYQTLWDSIAKGLNTSGKDFCPFQLDARQLQSIFTVNPLVVMGMSFEKGRLCFNATPDSANTLTASIMNALLPTASGKAYANAAIYFSRDFKEIEIVYDGKSYTDIESEGFQQALKCLITCVLYFFEVCHACLHVYCYVMIGAANHVCNEEWILNDYLTAYREKVFTKYFEVKLLLTGKKNGLVVGNYWPADYDKAMIGLQKCFALYAKQKTASEWFNNVFCAGVAQIKANKHMLGEARKYIPLCVDLGKSVEAKAVKETQALDQCLVEYFGHTKGKDSKEGWFTMNGFDQWIQCQSMAGILHGNTLSLTRLIYSPYCVPDGNWERKTFSKLFAKSAAGIGTLMGLEEEFSVMNSEPLIGCEYFNVVKPFQEKSSTLQKEYWNSLDEDERILYGWILSVWGPNMEHATQLTITTYV